MKRDFWRRTITARWTVPVAALLLTLCIGSVAFAMNDTSSSQTASTAAAVKSAAATVASSSTSTTSGSTSAVVLAVRADASSATSTTVATTATTAEDSLVLDQAKENAILDLIRQKMSASDQATLDKLRAAAAGEQTQVQQAQASLSVTTAQITALVDKYLGIPTTTGTTGGSTGVSATSTTSAT